MVTKWTGARPRKAYYKSLPLFVVEWRGYKTACWIWKRCKPCVGGYVRIWDNGRKLGAHRYMYELVNGPTAPKMEIDHLCRNRDCVRPDHLEAVTKAVNIHRGLAPKIRNHELREIVDLRAYGFSGSEIGAWYGVCKDSVYAAVEFRAKGLPRP